MQISASGLQIHIIDDAQAGSVVLHGTVALLLLHPRACDSICTHACALQALALHWHAVHALLGSV